MGMPKACARAAATQGDMVQDGHIVPHAGRLPNDHPGGMVYHHAASQLCSWVDVHVHDLRHAALQDDCQGLQADTGQMSCIGACDTCAPQALAACTVQGLVCSAAGMLM